MIKINENYLKLQGSYLFSEIAKNVNQYRENNPTKKIIRLGIGDVTLPLTTSVIDAMTNGINEMSDSNTFKGYGPENGYEFLRNAISEYDYKNNGVNINADEIFISTGAKEDTANIQEIFSNDISIAITDPVYPVYLDTNVMAGRAGSLENGRYSNITYLDCSIENNFKPSLPSKPTDLIYLCFPNNPSGQVLTKNELKTWVDYALKNKSLILFDAAYEKFITEKGIPRTIYEIDGADKCAIEFRSLSKTAGFTGTRCAFTVVPKSLEIFDSNGNKHNVNKLWFRRQSTKFNGVAYFIQKGAAAVYTENGQKEINTLIKYYLENASIIADGLTKLNLKFSGGINAPYIWFKTPTQMGSWDFFHKLLNECQVVGTPGVGFGKCGEGYFRLSAFGKQEDVKEAIKRIANMKF